MHAFRAFVGTGALLAGTSGTLAATKLTPADIQQNFFNGQAFTASTPSNIKFTMVFTPDGRVTREPAGKSGVKGEGTWTLSKDGFCTTWKGSKPNCFSLMARSDKEWSVMKGAAAVGTWTK